ncbi:hypothetical protein R1flu_023790 [Riccia fluitans]|uniref:Uncharacterized protein n=1 Tax=Riccia fluitans TaxID=41844 RepID=A0ABD1XT17_9MARC
MLPPGANEETSCSHEARIEIAAGVQRRTGTQTIKLPRLDCTDLDSSPEFVSNWWISCLVDRIGRAKWSNLSIPELIQRFPLLMKGSKD